MKITSSRVINFYEKHPEFSVDRVNELFIDLLEKLTINESIISDKLSNLESIILDMKMKSEINNELFISTTNLRDQIKSFNENIEMKIVNKIYESKDDYIKNVSDILNSNNLILKSELEDKIRKENSNLISNLKLVLDKIIPEQRDEILNGFKISTNNLNINEINKLLDVKVKDLITDLNNKIIKNVSDSENRINISMRELRDFAKNSDSVQNDIKYKLSEHLNKIINVTNKGTLGEIRLYNLLCEEYPTYEIINSSKEGGAGDCIINIPNEKSILIETKEYTKPVPKQEVKKFYDDIKKTKLNGIFFSQTSGIYGKSDMHIDISDNNIMIFVHNTKYDIDKIRLSMNILQHLSRNYKVKNINDINITKEVLTKINEEYSKVIIDKKTLLTNLDSYYKSTKRILYNISMPSLDLFLASHFADKNENICKFCSNFKGKNKNSLNKHEQQCKMNPKNTIKQQPSSNLIESDYDTDSDTENNIKIPVKQQVKSTKPTVQSKKDKPDKHTNCDGISMDFINSLTNKRIPKKKYKGVIYYLIDNHLHKINEDNSVGDKYAKFNGKKIELL